MIIYWIFDISLLIFFPIILYFQIRGIRRRMKIMKTIEASSRSLWEKVYAEPWVQTVAVARKEIPHIILYTKRIAPEAQIYIDSGWEGYRVEVSCVGEIVAG